MLANPAMFGVEGATPDAQASSAWEKLDELKKSDFALKHAIDKTDWVAPGYILDGLKWLALGGTPDADTAVGQVAPADVTEAAGVDDG